MQSVWLKRLHLYGCFMGTFFFFFILFKKVFLPSVESEQTELMVNMDFRAFLTFAAVNYIVFQMFIARSGAYEKNYILHDDFFFFFFWTNLCHTSRDALVNYIETLRFRN